ncbi:MAG: hypothetical protein AB1578_18650 [Thermodesulfobacteriota bacterium]|jgi:TPR repeat protein
MTRPKLLFALLVFLLAAATAVQSGEIDDLRRLAEAGDAESQLRLGVKFEKGEGVA